MIETINKPYILRDAVSMSFNEQLELFFRKEELIKTNSQSFNNKVKELGQVFTPPILAKFMVDLIKSEIKSGDNILDPCIGPNTFFNALKVEKKIWIKGIEVDEKLINQEIKLFFQSNNKTLDIGSFFDLPITEKYNFIIENPPYVRQELLTQGINSKSSIKNSIKGLNSVIPAKSNLYIYFLLKSILHLKENGCMVAVIYDSWLYSDFGKFLITSFQKLGYLESIYHFQKSAFENVEVGATVIKFIKNDNKRKSTSYFALNTLDDIKKYDGIKTKPIKIKQKEFSSYTFSNQISLKTKNNLFKPLKNISKTEIQRGTSAIVNNYFLTSEKKFKESIPLIKNISKIETYQANTTNSYVLAINGSLSNETKEYLEKIKLEINATPNKFVAVKRNIASSSPWYKVKLKQKGNFLFNYYLRNNIDFIYNPNLHYSSDNFYSININSNELAYLAVLNSSFTRLTVLHHSRSQGNGLRKIQLYEFKEVPIIHIEKLSLASIIKLKLLGKKLLSVNRYKKMQLSIIEEIDTLLINEYNSITESNLTYKTILEELEQFYS